MTGSDPVNPASFWYFGNDATIPNSEWCPPLLLQLGWSHWAYSGFTSLCSNSNPLPFCNAPVNGPCVLVGTEDPQSEIALLGDAYPNPVIGTVSISFVLPAVTRIHLELRNALGQVVQVLADGEFAAGQHETVLDAGHLAAGIYFYHLRSGDAMMSKKLVVSR